jgi:hypothetical protein
MENIPTNTKNWIECHDAKTGRRSLLDVDSILALDEQEDSTKIWFRIGYCLFSTVKESYAEIKEKIGVFSSVSVNTNKKNLEI